MLLSDINRSMNLDNHQSIDVVALSWKLLDLIKQTCSPFSTLPDMCIYRPRSQCVWRNIYIIIVDYDLKYGHCSFFLSLLLPHYVEGTVGLLLVRMRSRLSARTRRRKEQHIIEPRQQERVQQLFIHHWYKKKTEDKRRKNVDRSLFLPLFALSPSLCLSACLSILPFCLLTPPPEMIANLYWIQRTIWLIIEVGTRTYSGQ